MAERNHSWHICPWKG